MPLDIQNLQTDTADARVDYGEGRGDINVVYRPSFVTEKTLAALKRLSEAEDQATDLDGALDTIADVNSILLQLIVSHDLTRNGAPVPLTLDGWADVPFSIRGDIIKAIFAESRLGESNGTASQPASRATSARKPRTSSRARA